jgi:hypothetical protein
LLLLWSELVNRQAGVVEDAFLACPWPHVAVAWTRTVVPRPSGCRMMEWLPLTLATLKPRRSNAVTIRVPEGWDRTCHAASVMDSSRGGPNPSISGEQRRTEVVQGRFLGLAFAVGADAGAQLGVGTPDPRPRRVDDHRHDDGTRFRYAMTVTWR